MKAFELMGEVDEQHQLHVQVPPECAPGRVRVVLVPESNGDAAQNGSVNGHEAVAQVAEKSFLQWIEEHAVDTGIEDLAHQHDHYRLGTPKRKDAS